jgi:osmotically-inducible protein OsmY
VNTHVQDNWFFKKDGMTVGPICAPVSREQIIELAERRIRGNAHLTGKRIWCDYRNGVLVLFGSVSTYYVKQMAQEVVAQVEGVTAIDNQVEVVPKKP